MLVRTGDMRDDLSFHVDGIFQNLLYFPLSRASTIPSLSCTFHPSFPPTLLSFFYVFFSIIPPSSLPIPSKFLPLTRQEQR